MNALPDYYENRIALRGRFDTFEDAEAEYQRATAILAREGFEVSYDWRSGPQGGWVSRGMVEPEFAG